jgi:hypothetical protein
MLWSIMSFSLSLFPAADILAEFDDPNIDKEAALAGLLGLKFPSFWNPFFWFCAEDDSPYPEVRSAVANTDDPDIPVGTLRAWVLGLIFAIIIPVCYSHYFLHFIFIVGSRALINSFSSVILQSLSPVYVVMQTSLQKFA